MDGVGEIKTDANGQYDFGIITVKEAHNIYYTCPNYVPVVRSYNAAMGSTVMDIVMGHRDSNAVYHTAGIMIPYNFEPIEFPNLFIKKGTTLSSDAKAILHDVAYKLKLNPETNIIIQAYSRITIADQKITVKKLKEIVKYLVEKEGISEDRLSTNSEINEKKSNLVEFK